MINARMIAERSIFDMLIVQVAMSLKVSCPAMLYITRRESGFVPRLSGNRSGLAKRQNRCQAVQMVEHLVNWVSLSPFFRCLAYITPDWALQSVGLIQPVHQMKLTWTKMDLAFGFYHSLGYNLQLEAANGSQ